MTEKPERFKRMEEDEYERMKRKESERLAEEAKMEAEKAKKLKDMDRELKHFIQNGRILWDGSKLVMFDDCYKGRCNLALVFDDPDVHTFYTGMGETEWIDFVNEEIEFDSFTETAKLEWLEAVLEREEFQNEDKLKELL